MGWRVERWEGEKLRKSGNYDIFNDIPKSRGLAAMFQIYNYMMNAIMNE